MTQAFSIRDHGAVGDGRRLDTQAVQRAIDACHTAGGGRVTCPPGVYLCGTLVLKDNVDLHVEAGATLLASARQEDYTTAHNAPDDIGFKHERVGAEHFIIARNARRIAITGRGTLDGHGRAFMGPLSDKHPYYTVPGWRPGQMITFTECEDVLLRDIRIVDAPYWTIWPHGCNRVRITGISIINDRRTPNADGVNPDSCSDVHISDCHFNTGDDCIALRSDANRLTDHHKPCENVTVTNCTMISPCCAVRFGYVGDAPIRNCVFSNLVISNTRTGINMIPARVQQHADRLVCDHGPSIQNISFNNIVMDTRIAWYLWIDDKASAPACISDIRISNVTATTERACYIGGAKHLPIERVRLSDIDLTVRGPMDDQLADVPYPYPVFDFFDRPGIPHAAYVRHTRDLRVSNFVVHWGDVSGAWRSAVRLEQAAEVEFSGVRASSASPAHPVFDAHDVQGLTLRSCRAMQGTRTFLRVSGSASRRITAMDNDLIDAGQAWDCGDEVPAGALREMNNLLP